MDSATHHNSGVFISVERLLALRSLGSDITLVKRRKPTARSDGERSSRRRGRGMEFAEVRPYQPGDDIRNIDWRVTARTQKAHTKLFQEEREQPVFIAVDQRSNMFFGSQLQFKSVLAAEVAAAIGWAAVNNNDRVGGFVVGDEQQRDLRPKRGKHAQLAFLHQLHEFNNRLHTPLAASAGNSINHLLEELQRIARPGSAVYVISDFHDFTDDARRYLSQLSRHSEVTLIKIVDPLEKALPQARFTVTDGHARTPVNGNSAATRRAFAQSFAENDRTLQAAARSAAISVHTLETGQPAELLVRELFVSTSRKKLARGK